MGPNALDNLMSLTFLIIKTSKYTKIMFCVLTINIPKESTTYIVNYVHIMKFSYFIS
jgi:hypothetical protein